jgi:hypothetical protein
MAELRAQFDACVVLLFWLLGLCRYQSHEAEVHVPILICDHLANHIQALVRQHIVTWCHCTQIDRFLPIPIELIQMAVLVRLDKADVMVVHFIFRIIRRSGVAILGYFAVRLLESFISF